MRKLKAGAVQEGIFPVILQGLISSLSKASAVRADCHIPHFRKLHSIIIVESFNGIPDRRDFTTSCHAVFPGTHMSGKGDKAILSLF